MARKLSNKFYLSNRDQWASSHVDARARHFWDNDLAIRAEEADSKVVSLRTFVASIYIEIEKYVGGDISDCNYLRIRELDVSGLLEASYSVIENLGHLCRLKIIGCLETLPNSICKLHSLQALELAHAGVKKLPEEMGNLISLRLLDLKGSKISLLPNSVWSLLHLRTIDLTHCRWLTEIPYQIGKLQNLRILNLFGTRLRHLPHSVCNIIGLEILDMALCSELQSWPQGLSNLVNLRGTLWFGVGRETGRRIGELQHLDNITALYWCNMENVENVEEAEMAALMNKKFVEDLSFRWSSTERNCGDEGRELETPPSLNT